MTPKPSAATKLISIRIKESTLARLRERAYELKKPYQTYMKEILDEAVNTSWTTNQFTPVVVIENYE